MVARPAGPGFSFRDDHLETPLGNFYGTDPVVFPVYISMSRGAGTVWMANAVTGGCNACHDASWPLTVP